MAMELIELGADEICIKDMAGIGRPHSLGQIVANIKAKHPEIPVQYHSHAGPGFNVASILEVCNAGCDYIDVGMEPLSWGTGHADLLTVQAMLKDAGYKVPEINMEAYMKVRSLIQEFMDDFLGLYISPKNRLMNSLLIGPGLPGGMMGSLMSDLEKNLETINKNNIKNNKPLMSQDQLLIKLFDEVAYVWPRVGYPPLGDSVQPVCEEPGAHECDADGEREGPLEHDRRRYLGHDFRQGRTPAGSVGSGNHREGESRRTQILRRQPTGQLS